MHLAKEAQRYFDEAEVLLGRGYAPIGAHLARRSLRRDSVEYELVYRRWTIAVALTCVSGAPGHVGFAATKRSRSGVRALKDAVLPEAVVTRAYVGSGDRFASVAEAMSTVRSRVNELRDVQRAIAADSNWPLVS
jgi:hypothetical protein